MPSFKTILQHSQLLPISFSIGVANTRSKSIVEHHLRLLCEESSRWRSACIDSYVLSILPEYVTIGSLPLLERVEVIGSNLTAHVRPHRSVLLLKSAPKLSTVQCIDFGNLPESILDSCLLLPQVTHYSAAGTQNVYVDRDCRLGIEALSRRLISCSGLVSLDLCFPQLDNRGLGILGVPNLPISLPSLHYFSGRFHTITALEDLLLAIYMPNLQSIVIGTTISTSLAFFPFIQEGWHDLLITIKMTMPHLKHICLPVAIAQREPKILQEIPCLQSLTLSDVSWHPSAPLYTWLKSLTFSIISDDHGMYLHGDYPHIRRLSLLTVRPDDLVDSHASSPAFETDIRFCSDDAFAQLMHKLQDMVMSRSEHRLALISADIIANSNIHCLKSFSLDGECLAALKCYAPDCHKGLTSIWEAGLDGRPTEGSN